MNYKKMSKKELIQRLEILDEIIEEKNIDLYDINMSCIDAERNVDILKKAIRILSTEFSVNFTE